MTSPRLPIHFERTPAHHDLRAGEVHLWRAVLTAVTPEARALLSSAESIRAAQFVFDRDRDRYIVAQALLRKILAQYLDLDPRDLRFQTGQHGQPELQGTCSSLRFNLSHTDDLMLLAVTHAREVGVDLEVVRANVPFTTLADHYFDPTDAWSLRLLPASERAGKFYHLWTSAEAQLKASGPSLASLNLVEPDRWSLLNLTPAPGYAAALAVEGRNFQLECWSWPG